VTLEPPDLPREFVAAAQRRRAVDAVAEIAHESGVASVTTAAICRTARMARTTFYGHFDGLSGCLRYSFAESYRQLVGPLALADGHDWLSTVESAIGAFYAAVAAHPPLAELCLVHAPTAREESSGADLEATVDDLRKLLAQARLHDGQPTIPLVEECLARVLVSLAASRARREEGDRLLAERAEMVSLVASAYGEDPTIDAPRGNSR
jgi:AcrR family transcriptional regulator